MSFDPSPRSSIPANPITSTESSALLYALEAAAMVAYEWNVVTDEVRRSANADRVIGFAPGTTAQTGSEFFDLIHPDDRDRVFNQIQIALIAGTEYRSEFRLVCPDGQTRWMQDRGQPSFDASQGQCLRGVIIDITERKRAEEALQSSEERFRLATNAVDGIVFEWNLQTGQVYRSEGLFQLIGVSVEDAESTQQWWVKRLHPDDVVRLSASLESTLATADRYEGEYRVRHADGRWVDVWERGQIFRDQQGTVVRIVGFTTDISSRKQTEAALSESEARYRVLAEAIPQFVWITTSEGRNEYVNRQFCDYTGLSLEQLLNLDWLTIIHPDDRDRTRDRWLSSVKSGDFYEIEYRFRRADGEFRWFLGQGIPLKNEQGQVIKWFGTCTDIDSQKQIESERMQLLQHAQVAREAAERANCIKDEFLAVLSHELRTPLNPILGWSKILLNKSPDADTLHRGLQIIERNAQLQTQLIEDLLDVSRILRGKLVLEKVPVNLKRVIEAAIETVHLAAIAKNIQIQPHFKVADLYVRGDVGRLQQIVWNLLSNAVKFTPEGGRVEVHLSQRDSQVEIQTIDTGSGISAEFLPNVFERFRQADSTTTRRFGGLGLGLAIVRQLVELHGGTIRADSAGEGQGATFTVRLPRLMIDSTQLNERDRESSLTASLAGLRILVVDDDADSREFVAFVLEQEQADVIALSSAIDALKTLEHTPADLLLSDVGMPDIDGYQLMQQIRAKPPAQGGQIPAIALTAYAGDYDQKRALTAGFQQHISKPIDPEILVQAIMDLIRPTTDTHFGGNCD
ncbi:PAS domain S-box protein [Phormidesmis priestleyi ULC007]|uniref:Circadian input-output histidine kinase CikA n=1 Tax=Phormidesmis priestleyi ULC007 TaxID=1920490 RepID=A0A2T1DIW0_9CYAN|nr:PAS domain-containing hybrid sensor histidine kinase/response regulator [Phormidesmis priestleyi]PSB20371.1 PAS domain S-box protein [Phormidesmis priestleyi ULC007]PZO52948.1 MAG: PAS domain S-box protein [Phormidesmis priestleyi]